MIYNDIIQGYYTSLRNVTDSDEDLNFIIELRTDKSRGKYIHATPTDITFQREWIHKQQRRENDFYFMILNAHNIPVGTVSIYNIANGKAELGRWVSIGNALENMESVYLVHKWAFNILNLEMVFTKTLTSNHKVVNFWRKFGANMIETIKYNEDEISPGEITKDIFFKNIEPKITKMLKYEEIK